MKRLDNMMELIVNPKVVLPWIKEMIQECDPEYQSEEAMYLCAAARLEAEIGKEICPSSEEYLAALEQELTSNILFAAWQGFQLNLDCFKNPINKLRFREDFESLTGEHQMSTMPMARSARCTIFKFFTVLPPEKLHLTVDIADYYAYLQTYADKLAHYVGFCLADRVLQYTIPGYVSDVVLTEQYTRKLKTFVDMDVS